MKLHTRMEKVNAFWSGGKLDKECNVQFGEAVPVLSDGKLNTLVKDPFGRQRKVMETFVRREHRKISYMCRSRM